MSDEPTKALITESTMDDIGNAIRSKNGESTKYYPSEMPAKIRAIPQEGGAIYYAGDGIDINDFVISVAQALRDTIAGKADTSALTTAVANLTSAISQKSKVTITPTQVIGTKVADYSIDGVNGALYAPEAGAGDLADLGDVDLTNLSNGQILKYNSTSHEWENANESGGTTVVANPVGTPTDDLDTIQIGNIIYDIIGGGGGSKVVDLIYENANRTIENTITLDNPYTDYDFLVLEISDIAQYSYKLQTMIVLKEQLDDALDTGNYIAFYQDANAYLQYVVTDTTTLTKDNAAYECITKIYGVKMGSGSGGSGGGSEIIPISAGDGTTSRTFQLSKTPKFVTISWTEGDTSAAWNTSYWFNWGDRRTYGMGGDTDSATYGQNAKVAAITYGADGKSFTISAANAGSACNSSGTDHHGFLYVDYGGGGGAGGASALEDLTDVDLTSLSNDQILKWNATAQKWVNANESGGGSSLPFDVVIDSNDNGINLVYDDGT